jgi:hypothetical protein
MADYGDAELQAIVRRSLADAWDQGHEAARGQDNPYRAPCVHQPQAFPDDIVPHVKCAKCGKPMRVVSNA